MGSQYVDVTFPACSERELHDKFRAYQDSESREYGSQAYSGTMATCSGLGIQADKLMTPAAAQTYVGDNTQKWEACLAVRIYKLGGPEFYATEGSKPFQARIDEAQRELRTYPQVVLARIRGLTPKTKGCRNCGSSISVTHIRSVQCPVCHSDYLYTETDRKKIEALESRLQKAQQKYEHLRAAYDKQRMSDEWEWYVGGWAAC